MHVILILVLW